MFEDEILFYELQLDLLRWETLPEGREWLGVVD